MSLNQVVHEYMLIFNGRLTKGTTKFSLKKGGAQIDNVVTILARYVLPAKVLGASGESASPNEIALVALATPLFFLVVVIGVAPDLLQQWSCLKLEQGPRQVANGSVSKEVAQLEWMDPAIFFAVFAGNPMSR
ncbi:hypothetical protein E2562_035305 [Oryza meyeriana var. granulata]|uniref:Uncharacterized protein n=1 Tax=Oryza meyeriana var. granulata TaxID=110450 RepID=A0A6G1CK16_9ORYZ|nr:hypothetical protein E2562_035305 [Oryza meyeriana var. granulata]